MFGANRFSSLPGDHTLADEKATIGPRINALHHRERAAGCNIEGVSLKAGHRQSASGRLLDRRLYGSLDGGNILWPFERELIQQSNLFNLPMPHHDSMSCFSQRLNQR